ncbi:HK97 family phage prohead protease [uncultured Varibaculum sp.]|uniref:HK97 family phage prohead protease n=1 Tax=uncultured Varibaculum sp. TaxID=413896 RepID=UPI00204FECD4|nr:HK97 family phage prohead protease [uncultured Varibaculum sp.]DAM52575.1 MAG TPA: prohead serine protease [Caudoviricetes sp.]
MKTIIIGAPCAGKTTYARQNRKAGDPLIDFDRLVEATGGTPHQQGQDDIRRVAEAMRKAGQGRGFADDISADVWAIHTRPSNAALADMAERGIRIICLDPGKDICLERAVKEARSESSIEAIKAWYENPPVLPAGAERKNAVMKTKKLNLKIDRIGAKDNLTAGQFTGYASVFGNVDSVGDKIVKGAFAESLKDFGDGGAGIPCYWCHETSDPEMNLGTTLEATEDEHGLFVKVQLDLDNPKAAYAYKLLKEQRVRQMSFAYQVTDGASKEGCFEITGCKIFEVSIVPVGANQATSIESVKALQDEEDETTPSVDEATDETSEEEPETDLTEDLQNLEDQLAKIVDLVAVMIEKNQGEETPDQEPTDEPGGTGSETEDSETDPRKGGKQSVKKEADEIIARANHLLNL